MNLSDIKVGGRYRSRLRTKPVVLRVTEINTQKRSVTIGGIVFTPVVWAVNEANGKEVGVMRLRQLSPLKGEVRNG